MRVLGTDYCTPWARELTRALLPGSEFFAAAAAVAAAAATFFYNRAGVSKFYFRCFQNATGSSSGPNKVPELRIELEATVFHAGGHEIG